VSCVDADTASLVQEVLNAFWSHLAGDPRATDGAALERLHVRLDEQMVEARGANWEEGEPPDQPIQYAVCCSCTLPVAALRWPDNDLDMGCVLDHYFDVWNGCSDIDSRTYNREHWIGEVTWAEHIVRWLALKVSRSFLEYGEPGA